MCRFESATEANLLLSVRWQAEICERTLSKCFDVWKLLDLRAMRVDNCCYIIDITSSIVFIILDLRRWLFVRRLDQFLIYFLVVLVTQ